MGVHRPGARTMECHTRALQVLSKPDLPNETLIINELIREYLVWHNLRETLSVFVPGATPAQHP